MDTKEYGEALVAEIKKMESDKDSNILPLWKDISSVLIPELGDMDGSSTLDALLAAAHYEGQPRAHLETASRAMYSLICGPGTNWLQFGVQNEELMRDLEVRKFFDTLRMRVLYRLADDGFYKIAKPAIKHCLALGTTVATVTREPDSPRIDYIHWHPGDYFLGRDATGRTDKMAFLHRKVKLKNLLKYDHVTPEIIEKVEEGKGDEEVKLWIFFRKNTEGEPDQLESSMPYSVYHMLEDGTILHYSGMKGLPGPAWLWEQTSRLDYGLGPGYSILRDILQSNKIRKIILKVTERESDPPLWVPNSVSDQFFTDPGSIVRHDGDGSLNPKRIFERVDLTDAQILRQEIDTIVRTHLMIDSLTALTQKTNRKTTDEVAGIQSEMGAQVAPAVYSIEDGFLRPTVKRTLLHLQEMGELPEPPNKLLQATKDYPIDLMFMGPLSIANQYLYKTGQAHRMLNEALIPIAQIDPDGLKDVLNTQEFIRLAAEGIGGGYRIIRSEAEIAQIQQEREAAMQQEQLMAQAQMMMKDGGKAPEPGSPLEQEMNGGI